jgi:antitoxin CptB
MSEPVETRRKRLRMRSWHRGTREMDLILGRFADARLAGFDAAGLDGFDLLLSENDHDLYRWISRAENSPAQYEEILGLIRAHHRLE